jgi:hypothetical protein
MKKAERRGDHEVKQKQEEPRGMRLPGFVNDEDVGLGDAIKRMTSALGIKPCGGCQRRAEALNGWITFSGRRPK